MTAATSPNLAPQNGDTVHVEYDATYSGKIGREHHVVRRDGRLYHAPHDAVITIIVPPAKVGDTVTTTNVDTLGHDAVVIAAGGLAAQVTVAPDTGERIWRVPGGGTVSARTVVNWPATVLHVGVTA